MTSLTLAFDVYGTLFDTRGVVDVLRSMVGDIAEDLVDTWRSKQLEYSFRRGVMNKYVDFAICTEQALQYTLLHHGVQMSVVEKRSLLDFYKKLPIYPDARACLSELKSTRHEVFAFSNGSERAVRDLIHSAGINQCFTGVVSVEGVRMFKPHISVYEHFNKSSYSEKSNTWLVSGNSFDVIGAADYGMKTVFVRRLKTNILDPWDISPTATVNSLEELPGVIEEQS